MAASGRGPRPGAFAGKEPEEVESRAAHQELPESLTVEETLDWVSGDKARAQKALKAEEKRDNPRNTLLTSLKPLVNDETGAGVASGEA